MLINLRNALMAGKRLPYDAEVEYLESTGTQWIDTGVKVADPATISISVDSDGVTPFGVIHNNVGTGTWLGINYRTSATEIAVYRKNYNSGAVYNISAGRHTFKWDGATGFLIDGVSKSSFVATVGTDAIGSISWPLFGRYDFYNGSVNGRARSKFYGANIEISGTLVRDFIPVRKGTVGYLYDRVSGKLFGNAGTGDFVVGPDVVPVEYIESHGTEYIDVGPIVGADEVIVKLSASSIPSSGSYKAFGVGYTSNFGDDFGINSSGWCGQSYAPVSLDTQSTAKMNQSGRFIDSKNLGGSSSPFFTKVTAGNRLFLFCGTNGSSAYIRGSGNYMAWRGRFYSCVVSSSGNKMFNHLPIRVGTDATSWEGAMMDTLTRRIYRNQGTGAFAYGNDLKYPIPAA